MFRSTVAMETNSEANNVHPSAGQWEESMAKTDMERVGVFSESGYTTIGDPYVPPSSSELAGLPWPNEVYRNLT